jgi:hypothetical protein
MEMNCLFFSEVSNYCWPTQAEKSRILSIAQKLGLLVELTNLQAYKFQTKSTMILADTPKVSMQAFLPILYYVYNQELKLFFRKRVKL